MVHPKSQRVMPGEEHQRSRMIPVYPLTSGLKQQHLRRIISAAVDGYVGLLEEALPDELREPLGLCDIQTAIRQIHFPDSPELFEAARYRLVFQELLILQLALAMRRYRVRQTESAEPLPLTPKIRDRILGRMPFQLSQSQADAFAEIAADLQQPIPMNRLLHGDVGTGKTAVAACAILQTVAGGSQAALMAPTEILARQHERTLREWLRNSRVRIALWTGSVSHRQQLGKQIEEGEIDIVVGTQAIVESKLKFQKLGLVVIDEQHRFGVRQRAQIRQLSGTMPHYLVMTATPIPRTVTMTVFGDLDVSVLTRDENRQAVVHTYLGDESKRDSWYSFVARKLRDGRQAWIVAPLVQGDDESVVGSAEKLFENLANGPLEAFRIDLLHGRQSAEEKDAALRAFASGQTQVIVATSIVEVGIDVPNATVMTIESAERFGLSQLHQLRGRVSRSEHAGFVCLFPSVDQTESNERLQALVDNDDGFRLAEIDLEMRGPGNLFGTEQTGFPPLLIADLSRDSALLESTRETAIAVIHSDPTLTQPQHSRLHTLVTTRYGAALELGDVG
jgi:ATP-dependent DNA helicase RecG